MKKIVPIMIISIVIRITLFAQSVGDYRSIGNGNWNDPTKWELFDGNTWIAAISYPGQNPGTGSVGISDETEIKITETVPNPVTSIYIDTTWPGSIGLPTFSGLLTFSSENPVSLTVSGDLVVGISGTLSIENQNGAKTHVLFVGGDFTVEYSFESYYPSSGYSSSEGTFISIDQDDKLHVVFNPTGQKSKITALFGITFQDITFNGTGFILNTPIDIYGTATFINGIVTPSDSSADPFIPSGQIVFHNGAGVSGASDASFVDGIVYKSGNDPFTFPIGDEGIYAPLTISAPFGQSEYFIADYIRSSGASQWAISDPGLYSVSNCEYWVLNHAYSNTTNYPIDVTVGWNSARGCGSLADYITNVPEVTLARLDGYVWGSHGGYGIGTTTNGSVTWSGVNTFGSFTLGNVATSCRPPSELTTTNITTNSATLSWSEMPGALMYDVEYKSSSLGSWINVATGTTGTSINLSGLSPAVTYDWKVRSNCSSTESSYRQAQFTTLTACDIPTGLSTKNITFTSATLSWGSVANAINYDVDYEVSPIYSNTGWINAATAITSTSLDLSGLSPSVTYYWRVRANCSLGPSLYAESGFMTLAICSAPTGLSTTNVTSSSATLNWNAVPDALSYHIEYSKPLDGTGLWTSEATGITSLSYNLSGLSASTIYLWRVGANCGEYSGLSSSASFTTACNDVFESNNTSNEARTIMLGTTISAGISSDTDIDWFKFSTPDNNLISLEIILSDLPADYDLYVYDKSRRLIISSASYGTSNEAVIFNSNRRKADYYIKVVSKSGDFSFSQCYSLLAQVLGSARHVTRISDPINETIENLNSPLLYPNPTSEFLDLYFNSTIEGASYIQIFNAAGQIVKQYPINITKGYNEVKIPVVDITPGIYLLRMNKGELKMTRKFVITR